MDFLETCIAALEVEGYSRYIDCNNHLKIQLTKGTRHYSSQALSHPTTDLQIANDLYHQQTPSQNFSHL